ncbi:hypothetical protein ACLKA6_006984 [Drosophila palustris]
MARFEFTKVKIKIMEDGYAIVEKSHLQAVNRSLKLFDLRIKLLQLPVINVKVSWVLLKRSNGYLPYSQNFTVDVCQFFKSGKNLITLYIFSFFKDYTNFNHSCPYNHDIILEKFPTYSTKAMTLLPLPGGDYAVDSNWYTDGKLRAEARIYFTLS